ncbi:T9SS type A sorting domain-containing protein [Ferruginibacter sp.]
MKKILPSYTVKTVFTFVLYLLLSTVANAQTYTSISNGLWSNAATWQGGVVPPASIPLTAVINIKHSVSYDMGGNISNYGTINITNPTGVSPRLIVPTSTQFENFLGGKIYITNGEYRQYRFAGGGETGTAQNGSFKNTGGYINIVNSYVEVADDWINQTAGVRILKNSVLTIGGNYTLSGLSLDTLYDASVSVGWHGNGDFSVNAGTVYFQSFKAQLAGSNGNFKLNGGIANGDIDYITFKNHATNTIGNSNIFASGGVITAGVNLDAYCGGPSLTFNPNGKFSGTQTENCSLNYFPATIASQGPAKLNFTIDPVLVSGTALQLGAVYKYEGITPGVDVLVKIDSLIGGASITKIDDNAGGLGYLEGFQPEVKSGSIVGESYAVFKVNFKISGSNANYTMNSLNITALDIDGSNSLKEFDEIALGAGASAVYMGTTMDISMTQPVLGTFRAINIAGVERSGIDTASIANMFSATNTNVSSFTVKLGTLKTNPSQSPRQYGMYMKGFVYPNQTTLPLNLESFNATLNSNGKKADLKWITSSEINVNRYVVERSTDAVNFTDAAVIFANTTSTANTYSIADNIASIQSGVIYYRLRMIDNDGKYKNSATVIIRLRNLNESTISIQTFPNPTVNDLHVTIPATWQNKEVLYDVINSVGQVTKRVKATNSNQTQTINVNQLTPGVYVVNVYCGGVAVQQKFIKQ